MAWSIRLVRTRVERWTHTTTSEAHTARKTTQAMYFWLGLLLLTPGVLSDGEEAKDPKAEPVEEVVYNIPKPVGFAHIAEHFDDLDAFQDRWVLSEATKDGAEDSVAKYNGGQPRKGPRALWFTPFMVQASGKWKPLSRTTCGET